MKECIKARAWWFYLLEKAVFVLLAAFSVQILFYVSEKLIVQPAVINLSSSKRCEITFFHHHLIQQDPRPAAGLDRLNMTNHTSRPFSFLLSTGFPN